MIMDSEPRSVSSTSPSEILKLISDIDARAIEVERTLIEERTVALSAVVKQLVFIRKGFTETVDTEAEMIHAATHLIGELGLGSLVSLRNRNDYDNTAKPENSGDQAARLKSLRTELGLSQTEFGKKYSVSRYVVCRAERGHSTQLLAQKVFATED